MSWRNLSDMALGVAIRTFADRDPVTDQGTVLYVPKIGLPYDLEATFDEQHFAMDADLGVTISSKNPVIGVRLALMTARPEEGDRVRVRGVYYRVVNCMLDGVAGATLELML
jgi:hypothetical protein